MKLAALLCFVAAAGCASADAQLAASLRQAPADQTTRILFDGAEVGEVGVPIAPERLPRAVARAVDMILPEGTWGGCFSIVTARGAAVRYRITKEYSEAASGRHRSTTFAADGSLLQRSHSLAEADVAAPVLARLRAAVDGSLERVDAVQGPGNRQGYRAWARAADGARWVLHCGPTGQDLRRVRLAPAELWVLQP